MSKLMESDVVAILGADGTDTQRELAKKYGVSQRVIWNILNGRSWRQLRAKVEHKWQERTEVEVLSL